MVDEKKEISKGTLLGKIMIFYPVLVIALAVVEFVCFVYFRSISHFIGFIFVIYLFPVITFRIHNIFFPLLEKNIIFPSGVYPVWWGTLYIQRIYLSIPVLENILRMIPGLYSFWLRLWGSRVGKNVFWATNMEISDRSMMEIGDFVIFGNYSSYYCHVLTPSKDGRCFVKIKKIKIGSNVFIGAWAVVGPGLNIPDCYKVNMNSKLYKQSDLSVNS